MYHVYSEYEKTHFFLDHLDDDRHSRLVTACQSSLMRSALVLLKYCLLKIAATFSKFVPNQTERPTARVTINNNNHQPEGDDDKINDKEKTCGLTMHSAQQVFIAVVEN